MTRVQAVRAKIERADKHIRDLRKEIERFLGGEPYKVASKPHVSLPWGTTFFVQKAEDIPGPI
ncbi:MAG: hypothetical protein WAK56_14870, partial [Candidatus Sulfotelmatobacter sp.]